MSFVEYKMKKTLKDINVENKKILVRVDFNVPLDINLKITSDKRIVETLPTIEYLLKNDAAIILMSHLGRPNGKVVKRMSLEPVSKRLSELLNMSVKFIRSDCIGFESKKIAVNLKPGEIFLLENLRFHPGEEGKGVSGEKDIVTDIFSRQLASMGDIFVQDAFGTLHRSHASTTGIVKYVHDAAMGFLVEKELNFFYRVFKNLPSPIVAVLGGSKISDKMDIIENLLNKVDFVIIGGAMAYTFLKSQGISIGTSFVEDDKLDLALELIKKAKERKVDLLFPIDHIVTNKIDFMNKCVVRFKSDIKTTVDEAIPEEFMGVDIGPRTIEKFSEVIKSAKAIIWNGALGIFEISEFSKGTFEIAEFIAEATDNGSISVVGGGDSISSVKKAGVDKKISYISTGGGAFLEFLKGKELPGIAALPDLN